MITRPNPSETCYLYPPSLPTEILLEILLPMTSQELLTLRSTSHYLNRVFSQLINDTRFLVLYFAHLNPHDIAHTIHHLNFARTLPSTTFGNFEERIRFVDALNSVIRSDADKSIQLHVLAYYFIAGDSPIGFGTELLKHLLNWINSHQSDPALTHFKAWIEAVIEINMLLQHDSAHGIDRATQIIRSIPQRSYVNLSGLHLPSADLHEINLTGIFTGNDFEGCNFHRSDLHSSNFNGSTLWQTNLREANFSFCRLNGTRLYRANMSAASFQHATFKNADPYEIIAIGTNFSDCDFTSAHMNDSDFTSANFEGANFTYAKLLRCNFSNTNLTRANFVNAHIGGTNFQNACLNETVFTDLCGFINKNTMPEKCDIGWMLSCLSWMWNIEDESQKRSLHIALFLDIERQSRQYSPEQQDAIIQSALSNDLFKETLPNSIRFFATRRRNAELIPDSGRIPAPIRPR